MKGYIRAYDIGTIPSIHLSTVYHDRQYLSEKKSKILLTYK